MKPINWHPNEQILRPATGMEAEVAPLPVLALTYPDGSQAIASCWELNWKDIVRVVLTRKIFVAVMGVSHPPILVRSHPVEVGIPMESFGR